VTQFISIKRGSIQLASKPIPEEMQTHTTTALSKIAKFPTKYHSPTGAASYKTAGTIMNPSLAGTSPSSTAAKMN
jgi:hypothetical protein